MNVGEYWQHKKGEPTLRLNRYMGNDLWECTDMDLGDTADVTGQWIYENYNKVIEDKYLENLNEDWVLWKEAVDKFWAKRKHTVEYRILKQIFKK